MSSTARFDFSGARVLVTGATSGIGRATAEAFAAAGARVLITGQRDSLADYSDAPSGLEYRPLRLDSRQSIAALAGAIGEVDVLVNNAGHTMPEADFAAALQVNLTAVFELTSALREKLAASRLPGGASVVALASMMSFFGSPYFPGYGAAKAGIVQLTRTLAASYAKDRIRVNAVAPGSIPTQMTARFAEDSQVHGMVSAKTPMGRWGRPEEIAGAILFLSSTAASFITGHTLVADGGYSVLD